MSLVFSVRVDSWNVGCYVELEKLFRVGAVFGIVSSWSVGHSVGEVE